MVQISLRDLGISEEGALEVDYIKADIVSKNDELPQHGLPLVYRSPLLERNAFFYRLSVKKVATIGRAYPELNFSTMQSETDVVNVLTVNTTGIILLEWDFSTFKGKRLKAQVSWNSLHSRSIDLLIIPKNLGRYVSRRSLVERENGSRITLLTDYFLQENMLKK